MNLVFKNFTFYTQLLQVQLTDVKNSCKCCEPSAKKRYMTLEHKDTQHTIHAQPLKDGSFLRLICLRVEHKWINNMQKCRMDPRVRQWLQLMGSMKDNGLPETATLGKVTGLLCLCTQKASVASKVPSDQSKGRTKWFHLMRR